ncbi:hypothetical protein PS870_06525 [Pseudomonas fluorescens]|uniref:Uncharacterized protein n=1 Tax=Pseudomonas fluorescens TaxID=294 RepID=A0A5E7QJY2_PSEFL|nr:hypothetical protein [Pseudomonas fluorescens]VVP62094.1 hypothetical protein PS870_06525 [Pseudomonas fluorescens]
MRTLQRTDPVELRLNNDTLVYQIDNRCLASHPIFFIPLGASANQTANALDKEVPVLS